MGTTTANAITLPGILMSTQQCAICGKTFEDREKPYWWREYPDFMICKDCWKDPVYVADCFIRLKIARDIKTIRKSQGREAAKFYLDKLRGTGIPQKSPRKKRP